MGLNKEAMEGGPRLAQVRKTKRYLMITQVIVVFVAVIILSIVDGQIQMKPFYFNVSSFLYFVILMALIVGVEGMIFRALEIRYNKSSSSRYYILKASMRRSIIVIVIAAVALVIVATPLLGGMTSALMDETGETSTTATFTNRDALGLTTVDSLRVKTSGIAEVLVLTEENYLAYRFDIQGMRQHATVYAENAYEEVELAFPHYSFGMYYIVVNSDSPVVLTYTIHKTVSPYFAGFIGTFAILTLVAYAAWIVYITPVRKEYAKAAIYR